MPVDTLTSRPTAPAPDQVVAPVVVAGNLESAAAPIETDADVVIRGDVADRCRIESGGDVSVAGAVDAAHLSARRDVNVIGGILSRGRGSCSAGRDLYCRFASHATLRVGRDLTIKGDIAHCRIFCGGKLQLEKGAVIAGHIIASGGVACRTAGSQGGTPTIMECGVDPILRDTFAERLAFIETQRLTERRLRRDIDQLVPRLNLPGASRSDVKAQIDRMQTLLDRAQAAAADALAALRQDFGSALSDKRTIAIDDMLHRDVTFRFPGAEATVKTSLLGPLKVRCKTIRGKRQIVIEAANSVIELESQQFPEDPSDRVRRLLVAATEPDEANPEATPLSK